MLYTDVAPVLYDLVHLYGEDYAGAMADYPIWCEDQRDWLNERIFEHFAYREIAQETPAAFLFFLRRRMIEMMPVVNPIFEALGDIDLLEGFRVESASDTTTDHLTEQRQMLSMAPQTYLDPETKEHYATQVTDAEGQDGGATSQTQTTTGRNDSAGDRATNWLNSVNNGLYIIFNGLEPLFNQIWD